MTYRTSLSIVAFLWLVVAPFPSALGQVIQPLSFNYTTDDGLPSVECYKIIQDRQGYIWISTDNGIARYDGHEFEHFGKAQGLTDETIFSLQEDHRGWIWMHSLKGNFFIHRGDSIAAYQYNHVFQDLRKEFNLIQHFIVDEKGTLHVSLESLGVITVSSTGEVTKTINLNGNTRFLNGIYCFDEQVLWTHKINANFVRYKGLAFQIYQNWHPDEIRNVRIPEEHIPQASRISGKDVVAAFYLDNYYLVQYRNYLLFFDRDFNLKTTREFTHGTINSIKTLNDGSILVGFYEKKGLLWFDSVEQLQQNTPRKYLLRTQTISCITQDKKGGIWIASIEGGLIYIPRPEYQSFNGPTDINYYGALLRHEDDLWISTRAGRLLRLNNTADVQEIRTNNDLYEILELSRFDRTNQIITYNPVAVLNGGRWKKLIQYRDDGTPFTKVLVNGIVKKTDSTGLIFFVRQGRLSRISKDPPYIIENYRDFRGTLKNNAVLCGIQIATEQYWFGTRAGIVLVEADDKGQGALLDSAFTNLQVNDLALLPDKSLLVGTKGSGLLHFNHSTGVVTSILDDLIIKQIKFDKAGSIWAIANNGLYKLSFQDSLQIEGTFSNLIGLPSNSISDIAFWQDQCWISTPKEVVSIPLDFHKYKSSSRVKIKSITLNGSKVSLEQLENIPHNHELNLQYTAQNYLADQQTIYRYRLSANNRWIETNNYDLNFVDLAPDQYQLEIQALQNNTAWSASTIIPLDVRPPFYRRIWFILLLFVLGLLIIYFLFRQRLNNLQREKERLALQEEIGQLKQQAYRAQMNPHFIFNCLGTIQGMVIGEEADKDKAVRLIASFSQLIRYALEASRQEQVALKDEIDLLRRYLQLEQQRFSNRFNFYFNIDPSIELDWLAVPPMLVQPYVENAVLHGMEHKEGDGRIVISYQQVDEQLKITIEDNGPGISYTKQLKAISKSKFRHRSAGMTITQKRIELLSNSHCQVRIFEPKDKEGKVLGTTVELIL